jgi:hypothetical protein
MSQSSLEQLDPPPDAREKGGHEVLRCFVVDNGLSISMRRSFDDVGTWGVLLADLARHAAHIYAIETDVSEDEALAAIKAMFEAEWSRPADFGATSAVN